MSELSFEASAGLTYRFAADGRDGVAGDLRLRLAQGQPPAASPPRTMIRIRRVYDAKRTASFVFRGVAGSAPLARFVCRLDQRPRRRCESPKTYRELAPGWHRFAVWVVDAAGAWDPTPAVARFRIPKAR